MEEDPIPYCPSYGYTIRPLLADYELPRWRAKRVTICNPGSLTPWLRLAFKKTRLYPLADEVSATGVLHPFIWTDRRKSQLFIEKEGIFHPVELNALDRTLTATQQHLLLLSLQKSVGYEELLLKQQMVKSIHPQ